MFGNRLRAERKAKGMSQAQLAELCGVRANAQRHYEAGIRSPRADYMQRLSQIGLDVTFILFGARAPLVFGKLTDGEQAVIQSLRSLRSDDRQAVGQFMETLTHALAFNSDIRGEQS